MKKKFISLIIISIVVCAGGIVAINMWKRNTPVIFEKSYSIENLSLIEAGAETEGSLCMVAPMGEKLMLYEIILDEYIYFREVEGKRYPLPKSIGDKKYIEKYDKEIVELYNFKTGEVEKIIDFAVIAEKIAPGKQSRYWEAINAEIIDDRPYLEWKVYPIEDPDDFEQSEVIIYDLEAEKVVNHISVKPFSEYTEEEKEYFKSFYLIADRWCNFLETNGFTRESVDAEGVNVIYSNGWQNGIIKVKMPASMLPKNNARLYSEFPQLKEYDIKEGDGVKFFFAGYPDAEEIMKMFIEDGTELTYEGCILGIGSSIDREEHEISSIDDYIKWRDWKQVSPYLE